MVDQLYVVVFEDNQLELADADMIFTDKAVAEWVANNYQQCFYIDPGDRKLMVRTMKMDTRTKAKLEQDLASR